MAESSSENVPLLPERKKEKGVGFITYIYGLGNIIAYTLVGATVQAFGDAIPFIELQLLRNLSLFLTCASVAILWKKDVRVELGLFKYLPAVAILQLVSTTCSLQSLHYISTSEVACLSQAVVIVAGMSATWITTRVYSVSQAIAAGLCLIGLVLMTQPFNPSPGVTKPICPWIDELDNASLWINASDHVSWTSPTLSSTIEGSDFVSSTTPQGNTEEWSSILPGYALGFAAAGIGFVNLFLFNQKLDDLNLFVLLFWTSLMTLPVLLVGMFMWESPTFVTDWRCTTLLFGHLVSFSVEAAFECVLVQKATLVFSSLLFSLQLVSVLCVQNTLLKKINPGHRNTLEVIGAVTVVAGNAIDPCYQLYKKKRREAEAEKHEPGAEGPSSKTE